MTEYLTKSFEEIRACEDRKKIKYVLLPLLVEQYHGVTGKSWEESYKDVEERQLQFMEQSFSAEAEKGTYRKTFDGFTSEQTPVNTSLNCYRRKETGLPALRKVTLKKDEEVLMDYYLHGSPVPYEEKIFEERLRKTILNFNEIPGQDTLAEVRLLSPLNRVMSLVGSIFSRKYRTTLDDYAQLLETAIAAELSKRDIILFNFGVNAGRHYSAKLQKLINIRALLKLRAKISGEPDAKFVLDTTLNETQLKQHFLHQLRNPVELEHFDSADSAVKIRYNEILALFNQGWAAADNNYQIQAKIVELSRLLNLTVGAGCNDGKDRATRLAITIEANVRQKAGDSRDIKTLQKAVYDYSPHVEASKGISMPNSLGAGLDIRAEDGNKHFENNRQNAGVFKKTYTDSQRKRYQRKDKWVAFLRTIKKSKASNNIGRTFLSVALWAAASLATLFASVSLADTQDSTSVVSRAPQTTLTLGGSSTPGKEETTSTTQTVREENVSTSTNPPPPAQRTAEPMPGETLPTPPGSQSVDKKVELIEDKDDVAHWRHKISRAQKISNANAINKIRSRENSLGSGSSPKAQPLFETFDTGISRSMDEIFSGPRNT